MRHLLNKSKVIIHFALGMLTTCAISAHAKLPDCTDGFAGVCFYSGNTYKNGRTTADIYEGEVRNGLRQGNGTYTFADGKRTGFDTNGMVVRVYEGDKQGKVVHAGSK